MFASLEYSETCVIGIVLSLPAYFGVDEERVDRMAEHLLDQRMSDDGWNCESYKGATHSSFHTTISVLEGLREFLLVHRLFRSHRMGEVVNPAVTRFSFPPRWWYDALRVRRRNPASIGTPICLPTWRASDSDWL